MEITREVAENILSKQVEITQDLIGESVKGIRVGGISYADKDGNPWTYERSGDTYAIINLRAMSTAQMDEAQELLDTDPSEAVSKNLSISRPVEEAMRFQTGELVKATFDNYINDADEEVLICTSIVKQEAVSARANRFAVARNKAKAEAKAETTEATQESK